MSKAALNTGVFKLPCHFWGCICCKQLQSSQITIFTLLFTGRYNIGVLRRWFLNIEWEIFPKQFFFQKARSKLKEIHITVNTQGFVFTTWQEYTILTTISPVNEEQKATYNASYDMGFSTLSACFSISVSVEMTIVLMAKHRKNENSITNKNMKYILLFCLNSIF